MQQTICQLPPKVLQLFFPIPQKQEEKTQKKIGKVKKCGLSYDSFIDLLLTNNGQAK